jgi:hypothetical protein
MSPIGTEDKACLEIQLICTLWAARKGLLEKLGRRNIEQAIESDSLFYSK